MNTLNTLSLIFVSAVAMSSCSRLQYTGEENLGVGRKNEVTCQGDGCEGPGNNPSGESCSFNGVTVLHQDVVTAYKDPQANPGEVCVSQERQCINGSLSGTFEYSSCQESTPQDCTFNGQTVAHGTSVEAFQNSSVGFGGTCASEIRTCNNGALSGSFQYGSCEVGQPLACLFNGTTIPSGSSVTAYQNSTVAVGGTCAGETRTCTNGVLSGSYNYSTCAVDAPAACMFNGQTVPSGTTVVAYQASSVAYGESCVSQVRSCDNGVLSGTYTYGTCAVGQPASCQFNGVTVPHGAFITGFQTASATYPNRCNYEVRQCLNGSLTGSYAYASCNQEGEEYRSCQLHGRTIAHGEKIIAYKDCYAQQGKQCEGQERVCHDGQLSGSYHHLSCDQGEARWVNVARLGESYAATCRRAGGEPMNSVHGLGKGVCASTESRPGPGSGEGWNLINYITGTKNRHGQIYPQYVGGTVMTSSRGTHYCFKQGQKRDYDRTDKALAYLCWFR